MRSTPVLLILVALAACRDVREAPGQGGAGPSSSGADDAAAVTGTGVSTTVTSSSSGQGGMSTSSVVASSSASATASSASTGTGGSGLGDDEILASGLFYPFQLALSGDDIYVVEGSGPDGYGAVGKIPKTGGTYERLVTHQENAEHIVAGAGFVAWTAYNSEEYGGIVGRLDTASQTFDLTEVEQPPGTLVVDGDSVVTTGSHIIGGGLSTGQLWRVHPNHDVDVLLSIDSLDGSLAMDGSRVLFGNHYGSGNFLSKLSALEPGGATVDLVSGQNWISSMVADGPDVFFFSTGNTGSTHLMKTSTSGGAVTDLTTIADFGYRFAVDAGYVYYPVGYSDTVERIPRAGGTVEVLASSQGHPTDVAVDDQAIYWINAQVGEIHRITK